jgi:hypothetical protein
MQHPFKAIRATVAAATLLFAGEVVWAGPFDTGRYTRTGDDGLVSFIVVSNLSGAKQRLLEALNATVDLGFCKFQVNAVSAVEIPANYSQSDFLDPKFLSCNFSNDTCGLSPCTSENIQFLPSKFYKQGTTELCKTVKDGGRESPPYCFSKADKRLQELDASVGGVRIRQAD